MREILRTNNPVLMAYVKSVLVDEQIDAVELDGNISTLEGSVGAFQRRLMVPEADAARATVVLTDLGLI